MSKPTYNDLFKEFAKTLNATTKFTYKDVIRWFEINYPNKTCEGSIKCHLYKMSTNCYCRTSWSLKPEFDLFYYDKDEHNYRLYNKEKDPPPIYEKNSHSTFSSDTSKNNEWQDNLKERWINAIRNTNYTKEDFDLKSPQFNYKNWRIGVEHQRKFRSVVFRWKNNPENKPNLPNDWNANPNDVKKGWSYRRYLESTELPKLLEKLDYFENDFFMQNQIDYINSQMQGNDKGNNTEIESLVKSRIGQGKFRDDLIILWEKRCAISEYDDVNILKASHIKPWKDSSDKEKLDRFNGLLLLPNYDELFDRGYISFDNNGKIIFSACLSDDNRKILNLPTDLRLRFICDEHRLYLEYHRNNVLIM